MSETDLTRAGAAPVAPTVPVQGTSAAARDAASEQSLGTLVSQLSQQIPELVRSELRLAQVEMTEKGKRAGAGLGMFSAAGLLAFFGLGVLVTMCVLLLALVLPAWAAALVVALALLTVAGVVAMVGRNRVQEAIPAKPERTMESVREDVAAMKDAAKGEHR